MGNAFILKPSEMTPLVALRIVEIMEAGLPKGLMNIVQGDGLSVLRFVRIRGSPRSRSPAGWKQAV